MKRWQAPEETYLQHGPRHQHNDSHRHPPPPPAFGPGGHGPQPPHVITWEALQYVSAQLEKLTNLVEQQLGQVSKRPVNGPEE